MYDYNEEVFNIQKDKILNQLIRASESNLFYKKWFKDYNIRIDSINTYEDFKKIPILDKKTYIKNLCLFEKSLEGIEHNIINTSGSTGNPCRIFISKTDRIIQNSILCHTRAKKNKIILSGKMLYCHYINLKQQDYILEKKSEKSLHFAYSCISDVVLEGLKNVIDEYNPEWMVAPTSLLYQYAINEHKNKRFRIQSDISYIECISESLNDIQEKMISETFECVPINAYGSNEVNTIALSCNEKKLHLQQESVFLEIINQNSQGVGDIVVTSLANKYTPFIRYMLGDRGKWRKYDGVCPCGSSSYTIGLDFYRNNDFVALKCGSKLEVWFFNRILIEIEKEMNIKILQFQFIQYDFLEFEVKLFIKEKEIDKEKISKRIGEDISTAIGELAKVSVVYYNDVLSIDEGAGKFKYFISMIK